ncbi:MAG: TrkH family potassium uptake protein [Clostridiales bacterium]|nr:TrkH family potassium uptake protein [Clostridiales bacterium]
MKIKFNANIIKEVINSVSKIMIVISLMQVIPIITSLLYKEYNIGVCFGLGMCISIIISSIMYLITSKYVSVKSNFGTSLAIASITWVIASMFSALSLFFCGDYNTYMDAFFDSMSGFTTSGFSLIQDLDHVSHGVNIWRHLIGYIGGNGILVFALAFLIRNGKNSFQMYEAEGKDEKIFPSTKHTAKVIWKISTVFLIIGILIMTVIGIVIGLNIESAIFHGICNYMSAWSTCGFGPMSQNVLYYHSGIFEFALMIFMLLGCFNFILHFTVIEKNKKEIFKNIEIRTIVTTILIFIVGISAILIQNNIYNGGINYFRKVAFQVISANTGTGSATMYPAQFIYSWKPFAIGILVLAMLFGGSMSSTAGGFKALRISVILKGIIEDIKKMTYSEGTVVTKKIHHIKDMVLSNELFKSAATIVISYIIVFVITTGFTSMYGHNLELSMFESASVVGNVGLTCGIVKPLMPRFLKYWYIFVMWICRLEFISVFALISFAIKAIKKRGVTKIEIED